MAGQTWKNIDDASLKEIGVDLLNRGGKEIAVKNEHELWRIALADSIFTAYKKGTLYSTPSNSNNSEVQEARTMIDLLVGSGYQPPAKQYSIGMDETGKGEIAGPIILAGVAFPAALHPEVIKLIGPADTKKQHEPSYWEKLFQNLKQLNKSGLVSIIEILSPALCDKYSLNRLFDLFYRKLIIQLTVKYLAEDFRLVVDDYGAGKDLRSFLEESYPGKNEVIICSGAEDQFIEVKAASLISKYFRESIMERINRLPEYKISGSSVGNGNVGNPQTINWLKTWQVTGKEWPWFIKKSFKTIQELAGSTSKPKKALPALKSELLPGRFLKNFNRGFPAIHLFTLRCPSCGKPQRALIFDLYRFKCITCHSIIEDISLTLRYFGNGIVPDATAIGAKAISADFENNCLLDGYRVHLPKQYPGKRVSHRLQEEIEKLLYLNGVGRIKLKYYNVPPTNGLNNSAVYPHLLKEATKNDAFILTSSEKLRAYAIKNNIFSIFFEI